MLQTYIFKRILGNIIPYFGTTWSALPRKLAAPGTFFETVMLLFIDRTGLQRVRDIPFHTGSKGGVRLFVGALVPPTKPTSACAHVYRLANKWKLETT